MIRDLASLPFYLQSTHLPTPPCAVFIVAQNMDQWELVLLKAQQYIGMPVLELDDADATCDGEVGLVRDGGGAPAEEEDDDDLLTEAECAVRACLHGRMNAWSHGMIRTPPLFAHAACGKHFKSVNREHIKLIFPPTVTPLFSLPGLPEDALGPAHVSSARSLRPRRLQDAPGRPPPPGGNRRSVAFRSRGAAAHRQPVPLGHGTDRLPHRHHPPAGDPQEGQQRWGSGRQRRRGRRSGQERGSRRGGNHARD